MITEERKQLVKQMVEATNYGMLDCKKALELCNWNIVKAKELLDKKVKLSNLARI